MHDSQVAVLLEDINSKLDSLADSVSVMSRDVATLKEQAEPIPRILEELEAIKAVQREQGKDLRHINSYLVEQGMPVRA